MSDSTSNTTDKLNTGEDQKDPPKQEENIESNEDYQSVTKTLEILRRQLERATEDIDKLKGLKQAALEEPFAFSKIPKLQKIVTVPCIDWTKYRYLPDSRLTQQANALNALTQHFQNHMKKSTFRSLFDVTTATEYMSQPTPTTVTKTLQQELNKATQQLHQLPSRANSVSDFSDDDIDDDSPINMNHYNRMAVGGKGKGKRRTSASVQQKTIGKDLQASSMMDVSETESPVVSRLQSTEPRTPDEYSLPDTDNTSRNGTFKQPWSEEEQQRLQELLDIFPDEPIQAQRFNKISKALGTRTPKQVASRVQKYFIKLAKRGLPVPGRITIPPSCMPKGTASKHRGGTKPKPKPNRVTKPTTNHQRQTATLVGYNSVVSGGLTKTRISGAIYSSVHGPPTVMMSDDEEDYNVKEMMRKVAKPANQDANMAETVIHEGYACDDCGTEPIIGVLYKCTMCDVSEEVDLCGKCMEKGTFKNDHHTLEHTFEAIRTANQFPYYADNDYNSPEHLGEYSYLGF
ncbi:hypothetical protein K501DRAFT_181134 [Backusella circina FSU 941]|nr:hypothetical protein K501DRAFT_184200 [Backusella circina FSU 941]KAI8884939.1 hypothetical protein K501DRAFT_181134 [Backusella circina FSU 941]